MNAIRDRVRTSSVGLAHVAVVAFIGWVDYMLGEEIVLNAVYVLPILSSAYLLARLAAMLVAVAATIAWFLNAHVLRITTAALPILVWEAMSGLAVFLVLSYFVNLARAERAELAEFADTDPLTSIANRRVFARELEVEIRRSKRYGRSLAILAIDCDGLKKVNDQLGHAEGDRLIVRVARTVVERVRTTDLAARLGGDEFAVLLRECDLSNAARIAQHLVDDARTHARPVSIGVAGHPQHGHTVQELMLAADAALYRAKETGQGRVTVALDPASTANVPLAAGTFT